MLSKVICKIIQNRLMTVDKLLRESQCGFRPDRGCVDQLFCLRALMEKAHEFHTPLYLHFIDLTKAYDSVSRSVLWNVLEQRYHFPPKLLRIIKALHFGTRGKVRTYGHLSRPFQIMNGVRQGDVLAPSLFNLFLDAVMERALEGHVNDGVRMFYHPEAELVGSRRKMTHESFVQDLVYADDICLVAATREALEGMLHSVCSALITTSTPLSAFSRVESS